MDYSIKIGGEAGQGIQTIGDTLSKVFSRAGYHVFTHQDYESRIRGGHNFFQIRFSDVAVSASRDKIDIVIALDRESIVRHSHELTESGLIIYDSSAIGVVEAPEASRSSYFDIPFARLAVEHGGSPIMANTVATGSVLGMLRMDLASFETIIRETFGRKGGEVVEANLKAARAGQDFALRNCPKCSFLPSSAGPKKLLISGIEAIALGAIASGCKFYSAYPMTPSTGIMNYLSTKSGEHGIIVEQAEDEIAAINMAIGASFAGVRAMTGTAGGGFALMVEGLSLAGMTETPVVIALGQRPAPATGLPTRTEQGDLLFALHAAHGEFPRVVFAPGTPQQAFHLTNKAFDLAEKYQIPAFILFDQYLADSGWTYDSFDLTKIVYRDYRVRGESFARLAHYARHAYSETGVSPLGVPGDARHLVVTDSDEHDEEGHIIEDAGTRVRMVRKRLVQKMPLVRQEISPPHLYGNRSPDILLVCWGSLYGVVREVIDVLGKTRDIAMLHFSELYPIPPRESLDYLALLRNARIAINIEQNATGQFSRLLRAETGWEFSQRIHRYDGRPFTVETLIGEINAVIG